MGSSDLEEDGGLLVGDRCLHGDLVGEGIVPGEINPNLREAQLEEFELAKILVKEIAACDWMNGGARGERTKGGPVMSLPAPLTASCLHRWRAWHSCAYVSGFSPYDFAIRLRIGVVQSTSSVVFLGIEIIGDW